MDLSIYRNPLTHYNHVTMLGFSVQFSIYIIIFYIQRLRMLRDEVILITRSEIYLLWIFVGEYNTIVY